jgi:tetratricopeptide (TPR) repeat protein
MAIVGLALEKQIPIRSVFVSYRQLDDAQRGRVRSFAEKLRECGVNVVLDQFFLDENPGGPNDGWDKWSSDCALKSDYVLIIGNQAWYQCFDKTQSPGSGLGAACEADDLRHRIYKANGIVPNIRIVLLDPADSKGIPAKLERYHRFHAGRDFSGLVRWLGGILPVAATPDSKPLSSAIPNNLPRLQSFFGREKELAVIREALDPESPGWGALIDGPGGMGKTSLAIRAAYGCPPGQFARIIFLSVKERELDEDGVRGLSGFILTGLIEMLNELARELGQPQIANAQEGQRIKLLRDALRDARVMLILDNLESLTKPDRDQLFTFVKGLPQGCKAILTSRRRIGSSADALLLEKLDQDAALATLADLARRNPLLAKTSKAERLTLYAQTGGKPLLLRWTAGQLGRGSCRTFADALNFLRSCPKDNDLLEFVFGDLAGEFTSDEEKVLVALSYFTLPAKVEDIAALSDFPAARIETALHTLANRSLIVPNQKETHHTLVPMLGDFLRKHRPEVVAEIGDRLEKRAYELILENGNEERHRFPLLDAAWPTVAPALPLFIAGPNPRLQKVCKALDLFLDFTGRWDELISLHKQSEAKAVAANDFYSAGWRAYHVGWIQQSREDSKEAHACADRAAAHWSKAVKAGALEQGRVTRLHGLAHQRAKNYSAAIECCREALKLWQMVAKEHPDIIPRGLNTLAENEHLSGDLVGAERDYSEALRIARAIDYQQGIRTYIGSLAELELDRCDWLKAEKLAREALALCEKVPHEEMIAENCHRIAKALLGLGKGAEGLAFSRRAEVIFTKLRSPKLEAIRITLRECEE